MEDQVPSWWKQYIQAATLSDEQERKKALESLDQDTLSKGLAWSKERQKQIAGMGTKYVVGKEEEMAQGAAAINSTSEVLSAIQERNRVAKKAAGSPGRGQTTLGTYNPRTYNPLSSVLNQNASTVSLLGR